MKEVKFTTDGKKVVVLGSLNSTEKIVQEVFVIDGSEIPSGEHFVVKSLHDSPAVSWKESELKKIEERYTRDKAHYESETDRLYKAYKERTQELRAKLSYCGLALKNVNENSFNTLIDYITGEIKYIVIDGYDIVLMPIDQFNQMYEDKLRLISIFGKDDGSFSYAVGEYSDRSGGSKKFHPFKNYEDALRVFKEILLSRGVTDKNIELAIRHGFEYPKDKIIEYVENQKQSLVKSIQSYKDSITKWEAAIEKLSTMI